MPLIADHFLAKLTREMGKPVDGFAPEAMAALEAYQWPGNVRELENVVERAVALEQGRRIELATLPDYIQAGRPATPLARRVASPPPRTAPPARRRDRSTTASTSSSTCRTSSDSTWNGRCGRRAACRRTPPTCWD